MKICHTVSFFEYVLASLGIPGKSLSWTLQYYICFVFACMCQYKLIWLEFVNEIGQKGSSHLLPIG